MVFSSFAISTKHMIYTTEAEWLAANPIRVWRDSQTNENEVSAPMQAVADITGKTRSAVLQWENGSFIPKHDSMVKLADLMHYNNSDALYEEWQAWLDAKPAADVQPVAD